MLEYKIASWNLISGWRENSKVFAIKHKHPRFIPRKHKKAKYGGVGF